MKETITNKNAVKKDSIYISGKLTDMEAYPLPYANVFIKGTRTGTTSDFDGNYRLNVTKELDSLKNITLVYSNIGYETTELNIDDELLQNKKNRIINVEFNHGEIIAFTVIERAPFHKRVWNGLKSIFRKKK
ncbi:carboxypeptidase-like regulatory domain-containing protein [Nonlabens ponticola]|uniref:Carboxypeptidase-like regulatory domain-containing protein n=1 Tax=Nonlabens ponticola TaxID=2496866 RepID=A0A3S9MWS6_9FLAO|nr:carboxypeptidase-like regulatory domain-containing protein [Nonlabens ponticola]AZQ43592.1 carboxypeptidase-like regulatory domain-containing protein [Nonlabens ponticola]